MRARLQHLLLLTFAAIAALPAHADQAPGLRAGARIPKFSLRDQNGTLREFANIRGPKGALLVFYRSADWWPFCKSQLVELEQNKERLRKRGLGVAAISYDSVEVLADFTRRKNVTVPLLSDTDSAVIRSFGLLNESVPKNSMFFGTPHPVSYIVDTGGVIRSVYYEADYRKRFTSGAILSESVPETSVTAAENRRAVITTSSSDSVIRGGERVRLFVDIALGPKMHVYAPGVTGYIPISWTMEPAGSSEMLPVEYPSSRKLHLPAIGERVPVYEKKLRLMRDVIVEQQPNKENRNEGSSTIVLRGKPRYQVCDDRQCFTPEDVTLEWALRFEPHDITRAPVDLRRKW
jgi:peroxiredoxin